MRLNPLWIAFILICVSSVRRRMWATGTPFQMSLPYFKAVSTLLSMSEAHSSLCCEQSGEPPAASFLKPQHDKLAIHASMPHISTSVLDFWHTSDLYCEQQWHLWQRFTDFTCSLICLSFEPMMRTLQSEYMILRWKLGPQYSKSWNVMIVFLIFHLNNEIIPWKTNKHYQLTTDKIPYPYYFFNTMVTLCHFQ